ncbi:MAG TPA: hypothetical protein VHX15_00005, partial [Frankiaceae bacterium]|nr:hypothetical protein [Frankiaceae bacterium]
MAGATTFTVTPETLRSACTKASIPGAFTPSSLVTNTVMTAAAADELSGGASVGDGETDTEVDGSGLDPLEELLQPASPPAATTAPSARKTVER